MEAHMRPLTATQLTTHLIGAANMLLGRTDITSSLGIISATLIIKRASDQPGILHVPEHAQWPYVVNTVRDGLDLSKVMRELEQSNPDILDGVLQNLDIPRGIGPTEIGILVDSLNQVSLKDDDLEFSDVVGHAYDRFISYMAETAEKTR